MPHQDGGESRRESSRQDGPPTVHKRHRFNDANVAAARVTRENSKAAGTRATHGAYGQAVEISGQIARVASPSRETVGPALTNNLKNER